MDYSALHEQLRIAEREIEDFNVLLGDAYQETKDAQAELQTFRDNARKRITNNSVSPPRTIAATIPGFPEIDQVVKITIDDASKGKQDSRNLCRRSSRIHNQNASPVTIASRSWSINRAPNVPDTMDENESTEDGHLDYAAAPVGPEDMHPWSSSVSDGPRKSRGMQDSIAYHIQGDDDESDDTWTDRVSKSNAAEGDETVDKSNKATWTPSTVAGHTKKQTRKRSFIRRKRHQWGEESEMLLLSEKTNGKSGLQCSTTLEEKFAGKTFSERQCWDELCRLKEAYKNGETMSKTKKELIEKYMEKETLTLSLPRHTAALVVRTAARHSEDQWAQFYVSYRGSGPNCVKLTW